jgi:MoaA/NifB/PqqE/SkfB family radical SAM enzyme
LLKAISKIPAYYLFRLSGWPRKLPMSLTISVSFNCNSRCKTCNIYKKKTDELSLEEWESIFRSLGRSPFWVTVSGGEPFLRKDIAEIVCSLYDQCRPHIINIPTNGLLNTRIPELVKEIALHCAKSLVVVNLSLDGIGEKHDAIRGIPGNYAKALDTFSHLKSLNLSNLSVGIHTVVSRFNVRSIPDIYRHLRTLNPDSYITEIAEERVELDTVGADISPAYRDYAAAVDFLTGELRKAHYNRVGKITRAIRIEYYRMVKRIIREKRQIIPCYSGFASAQIAPDGNVWLCCVKAKSIGSLRGAAYDFKKVWFSEEAETLRKAVKKKECFCPLANAGYTNMLHNVNTLTRIGWNFIRMNFGG